MSRYGRNARRAPAKTPYDWWTGDGLTHHVLQIGQSNADGVDAVPPATESAPFAEVMMLTPIAAVTSGSCGIRAPQNRLVSQGEYTSLVPLRESNVVDSYKFVGVDGRFGGADQGAINCGETGMASMLHDIRSRYTYFYGAASSCGASVEPYSRLKKGTDPHVNGLTQIRAVRALATTRPSRVFALTVQHGESDAANASYAANLAEWLTDWTTDVRAEIPEQTVDPVMISTQLSTLAFGSKVSALQIFAAMLANPRYLVACPCYAVRGGTSSHRFPDGQRKQGAYFSKVYRRVVIEGGAWAPLYPLSASRVGTVVTVTFNVPVAPLVFDTPPDGTSLAAKGFEFDDDTHTASASSAAIVGNTVEVTLSGTPTGTNKKIRYAVNAAYGNLRDSDPAAGFYGDALFNWCLHFELAVS